MQVMSSAIWSGMEMSMSGPERFPWVTEVPGMGRLSALREKLIPHVDIAHARALMTASWRMCCPAGAHCWHVIMWSWNE